MNRRDIARQFLRAGLAMALAAAVPADAAEDRPVVSFQSENDAYGDGEDRWFTNGFRLAFSYPAGKEPETFSWVGKLLPGKPAAAATDIFFAIGQNMFTPADITVEEPIVDDRPYAGWLYLEAGVSGGTRTMQETLTLSLGVTGDPALAERSQNFVHSLTGSPDPRGWRNQLEAEPTFQLYYERAWFLNLADLGHEIGIDLSPHFGSDLGTVFVEGNAGLVMRIGSFLPPALPPRINPSATGAGKALRPRRNGIGWYAFAGIEGRAVAHNLFLDGGTFRDGHSVAKKALVSEWSVGAALSFGNVALSYTFVHRSREFELQPTGQGFGSLNVSVAF